MRREEKEALLSRILSDMDKYQYFYLCDFYKLPSRQFQIIRKSLKDTKIYVAKKNIVKLAIQKKGFHELLKYIPSNVALIFTDRDPSYVYENLRMHETSIYAKPNEISSEDIYVRKGMTDLSPADSLRTVKMLKIDTKIVKGKIYIKNDKLLVKRGEKIPRPIASFLYRLGIKPFKVSLRLSAAMDKSGLVYTPLALSITRDKVRDWVNSGFLNALKVSFNLSLTNRYTVPRLVSDCKRKALILASKIGFITSETIPLILQEAMARAKLIKDRAKI